MQKGFSGISEMPFAFKSGDSASCDSVVPLVMHDQAYQSCGPVASIGYVHPLGASTIYAKMTETFNSNLFSKN